MKRLLFLLCLLWAGPAHAQIIFEMNCTAGNFRTCNFDSAYADTANWQMSRVGAGCPNGEDSVLFEMLEQTVHSQFSTGWLKSAESTPSQGVKRIFRYRWKTRTPFTPNGVSDFWGAKFILMGGAGGTEGVSRFLLNVKPVGVGVVGSQAALNIGGYPTDATDYPEMSNGSWHSVQAEVQSSSTSVATDGWTKIWIDNDTYASPTSASNTMNFQVNGWGSFGFGGFVGATIAVGSNVKYEVCDFQYASTFDASYHANINTGGGGGGGVTRTRFRFFRVGGDAPAAGLAFACLVVPFLVRRKVE